MARMARCPATGCHRQVTHSFKTSKILFPKSRDIPPMQRRAKKQYRAASADKAIQPNNTVHPSSRNSLRIVGGQWRGRRLPIANLEGLRPTPDHLRETLFNWLMFTIEGARCMDTFAGTGALGTEALSRGAEEVTFLEQSPQATHTLTSNMTILKSTQHHIVNTDALKWLNTTPATPFDIVFLDPPFRQALLEPTCTLLNNKGWLKADSLIYVEHETELTPCVPDHWQLYKTKSVGQITACLFLCV